ncbi:bile acid:sodium symporter family protein [Enemella evansiae]|uniref:Bile acid:sodium symporter n=1 Tax=Enemella evansiae TaxID=2016499 RepID=A0A255GPD0_9ACTN|nr:bile acid:sodium symporter family protein [Enemella evansiae]OYO00601.1 hypothetical protein CGZ95_08160 [Enemella evansiae]OYO17070.1 hypothetical protein BI335_10015 [Enemella evansiae]OYO17669.1 hypothetical protein CGZ94_01925 [Enemella evansiae]TDO89711.1 sodium/bile acid cotransporter 7 [Enemella evansiae]
MKKVFAAITRWLDPYVLVLLGVVLLAAVLPARGAAVAPTEWAADIAVMFLFFLYGARLSTEETRDGFRHWRLHLLVLGFTFVLFPIVGWVLSTATSPLLSPTLAGGLLFLSLLPSTVQSSVAFTSMARGNVAASICAASFSNLLGVLITPLLVALLMGAHTTISLDTVWKLLLQLVLPFAVGQLLHKPLKGFLTRNKKIISKTDRLAILLVVYTAFSAGMREDMWSRISGWQLLALLVVNGILLAAVMTATMLISKALGFSWPDRIAIVFAGSKKSMASGLPMAKVLFPADQVGIMVLPLMLFHQLQLIVCAQLARRWSKLPEEPVRAGVEK